MGGALAGLDEQVTVHSLYGGRIAAEETVLAGMRSMEERLDAEFAADAARTARMQAPVDDFRTALMGGAGNAEEVGEAVRRLRDSAPRFEPSLPRPERRREVSRIFTGSIGATVAPPYDYGWTSNRTSAGAVVSKVTADRTTGFCEYQKQASGGPSGASARAAVGVFFRPPVANGRLEVSANPSFRLAWTTFCWHCSTHSDGFIGIYVGRYTLGGDFETAPIDEKTYLWNDDSWWYGTSDEATSSGFPLSAQFDVDSNHFYALWIWCGGYDATGGEGLFYFSNSDSQFSMDVPSITWKLT
jgi:hypothetical protein